MRSVDCIEFLGDAMLEMKLPTAIRNHASLSVIQAGILDLSDTELAQHVKGCDAVASCLGHNITL